MHVHVHSNNRKCKAINICDNGVCASALAHQKIRSWKETWKYGIFLDFNRIYIYIELEQRKRQTFRIVDVLFFFFIQISNMFSHHFCIEMVSDCIEFGLGRFEAVQQLLVIGIPIWKHASTMRPFHCVCLCLCVSETTNVNAHEYETCGENTLCVAKENNHNNSVDSSFFFFFFVAVCA